MHSIQCSSSYALCRWWCSREFGDLCTDVWENKRLYFMYSMLLYNWDWNWLRFSIDCWCFVIFCIFKKALFSQSRSPSLWVTPCCVPSWITLEMFQQIYKTFQNHPKLVFFRFHLINIDSPQVMFQYYQKWFILKTCMKISCAIYLTCFDLFWFDNILITCKKRKFTKDTKTKCSNRKFTELNQNIFII